MMRTVWRRHLPFLSERVTLPNGSHTDPITLAKAEGRLAEWQKGRQRLKEALSERQHQGEEIREAVARHMFPPGMPRTDDLRSDLRENISFLVYLYEAGAWLDGVKAVLRSHGEEARVHQLYFPLAPKNAEELLHALRKNLDTIHAMLLQL